MISFIVQCYIGWILKKILLQATDNTHPSNGGSQWSGSWVKNFVINIKIKKSDWRLVMTWVATKTHKRSDDVKCVDIWMIAINTLLFHCISGFLQHYLILWHVFDSFAESPSHTMYAISYWILKALVNQIFPLF